MRIVLAITAAAVAIFLAFPRFDLAVSGLFYDPASASFPLERAWPLLAMYNLVRIATWGTGIALTVILIVRKLHPAFLPQFSNRQIAFLLLAAILGPGISVHWGVKEFFGRARPPEVVGFGGVQPYTPPFAISDAGGKSFVSGHAAMGFYFTAFGLAATGRRRRQLYTGGLVFGTFAAVGRLLQGRHFLSDVVFAALLALLVNHVLARWMLKPSPSSPPCTLPRR